MYSRKTPQQKYQSFLKRMTKRLFEDRDSKGALSSQQRYLQKLALITNMLEFHITLLIRRHFFGWITNDFDCKAVKAFANNLKLRQ